MRFFKHPLAVTFARLQMRNPERLWLHYCFALSLFFSMILTSHLLNTAAIDRGVNASMAIKANSAQIILAQDILARAPSAGIAGTATQISLRKTINQLDDLHTGSIATQIRSEDAVPPVVGKDQLLYQRMETFVALARKLVAEPLAQRSDTIKQLEMLMTDGGLLDGLLAASSDYATQLAVDIAYFQTLQRWLFAGSAIVLLAEALLVFWPAQQAVQKTIRKMKHQTSVLRTSQSRLKEANGQLEHMILHDPLTGLPNRRGLVEVLGRAIDRGQATEWHLFLVGLDDFKSVNDIQGHDYGDALLVAVSRTLQRCVDYDNIVAHVGGDAFVLISGEDPTAVTRRINDAFDEPFDIKGRHTPVNASIGHLDVGADPRLPLDIVADAEIALQFAKNAGGNRAVEFTAELRDDLSMLQMLQTDLRTAITSGEIEPWFQPQVTLSDGRLHGVEVLARWRHPTRGLLTPNVFLPAAESAGLMVDLDHAVWKSAMHYAGIWQADKAWRPVISLNAAPDTISDPNLMERFLLALQRSGLDADQVIVEVLETTLINGKDDIAAINIDSLSECGIALELDDFGTGYASLSKLTQLPLTGIKLDRSLVAPLPDQAADSVVRAILALAAELGLQVIAEGVEEQAQAKHLTERGCGIGQGYGFARPMPPEAFAKWLHDNAGIVPALGQAALRA